MGAIFTPGLTVASETIVVKDRRLPLEGDVVVKNGQVVKAGDIVAKTALPGKIYPVNIANQLGIPASRLKSVMKKNVGDSVEIDELIAETAGIMGFFKSEARAIVSGTIENISPISGEVIFQAHPTPVEIDAYIDGQVVEIIDKEGCVIQSKAALIQGIFGLGGETRGELAMGVTGPEKHLEPTDIQEEMAGKIVVGGAFMTRAVVEKAIAVGVKGLITGGFDYNDIKEILGYEVGVAITGGEDLGLTIVVTEGFGEIQMAPATHALFKRFEGRAASLNGATQIRAGVIRPEAVITLPGETPTGKWKPPEPEGIAVGDTVRGIRIPYFGCIGIVKSLPVELKRMESETMVRVLEIEFNNGDVAILPRANVESIDQ